MSHEIDMSNGRANVAFVGERPWHDLGFELKPGAGIDEWRSSAGFDWSAVSSPVLYRDMDGNEHQYAGRRVLYRSDNGAQLSVVSDGYKTVQPGTILEFFRDLVEAVGGSFTMETAGCLRGGRKIWALAKAKDEIRLGREDVIGRYLLLATSFDKSLPTIAQQTSTRVVCWNTLSAAIHNGDKATEVQMRVDHSEHFKPDELKKRMMLDDDWAAFADAANLCAKQRVTDQVARRYFLDVLYPVEWRETTKRFFEKGAERQVDRMMEIMAGAPGQQLSSAKMTAWGLVNAVTYWVDHETKSVNQDFRLDKAWFGQGATMKNRAFKLARELAGARA